MTTEELYDKLKLIQKMKCKTQNLELKSAEQGYPKRLYDSLSSFSNQDDGGIIVFGIDEKQDYKEVGVYDAQDIQKKINEQCLQMNPVVRPLITVVEKENKKFVSAEIPGIDLADRPCYYQGRGRLKGSYTRIGDSDEPMTEYEIYSYEAYICFITIYFVFCHRFITIPNTGIGPLQPSTSLIIARSVCQIYSGNFSRNKFFIFLLHNCNKRPYNRIHLQALLVNFLLNVLSIINTNFFIILFLINSKNNNATIILIRKT